MRRLSWVALLAAAVTGCGDDAGNSEAGSELSAGGTGAAGGGSGDGGGSAGGGGNATSTGAQGGASGTAGGGASGNGGSAAGGASGLAGAGSGGSAGTSGGGSGGQPAEPPAPTCTPTITLSDTSTGAAVIGDGTPGSCTEDALRTAAEQGGVITFDCGSDPVTIDITQSINLPVDTNTTIDGGGTITLDAGKRTRHFVFDHPDWMNNTTEVVLQRLALRNGKAPAGEYFPPLADPECAYGYKEGAGGAIYMRNGNLRVIDSQFFDNEAALIGPDVGGGAIYALGSPSVVISGSRFERNRASNGGAVGMLFANPEIYNSVFEDNTAEGVGMNTAGHVGCPVFGHEEQGGAGGLSGAVYFDGLQDAGHVYTICGSVFRNNRANELAGALFRTPNVEPREMVIDRSVFQGNTARAGGVSFIKQNAVTVRDSLFAENRSGVDVAGNDVGGPLGGLWINEGSADIVNSTFVDNAPTGLDVDGGGTARNVTFASSPFSGPFTFDNCLFVELSCDSTAAGSNNVQWPSGTACAGDTTFADPQLGALAANGGPTDTLMPGNAAAVDGVGASCPDTDQRGSPRDTTSCAAGAVEP